LGNGEKEMVAHDLVRSELKEFLIWVTIKKLLFWFLMALNTFLAPLLKPFI